MSERTTIQPYMYGSDTDQAGTTYQLGAAQSLLDNAAWILHGAPRVYGASAGSLVAAAVVCGSDLGRVRDLLLEFARFVKQHPLGPMSPTVNIYGWLEMTLQRCLPDNAHTLATGRLHVSMTRMADGTNVIASQFHSKDDLIKALLCSCFIPVLAGVIPPQYKGEHFMDGGFTNIQPLEDSFPALTISPFAGNMDICPSDSSTSLCDAIIQQLAFQCSLTNFIRLVDAIFARDWRVLKKAFYSGYQDTVFFLQQNNALPLYPQRRKESDVSDDSLSSDHWMLTQTNEAEKDESQKESPEQPEDKSINGDCSSMSPNPVKVQEVLLCNIMSQLEIIGNSKISLLQRLLSYVLLLFTLPIWSITNLWDRYQNWLSDAAVVSYWLWHSLKVFMMFVLNIYFSTLRKALGDILIKFLPEQVHDEHRRSREKAERHEVSSNMNGEASSIVLGSVSMAQTLPKLYAVLFLLEAESKWRKRKIEVQHTLQQHVAAKKTS